MKFKLKVVWQDLFAPFMVSIIYHNFGKVDFNTPILAATAPVIHGGLFIALLVTFVGCIEVERADIVQQ